MKTPALDLFIYDSFERIKGLNIDCIEFYLQANKEIDEAFLSGLFKDQDVEIFATKESKNSLRYKFSLKWEGAISGDEYALLLGKIHIMCGKLHIDLLAAGIKS